ncbi:MAG: hypothetical protein ACJ71Z_03290 [Aeromicrobium sp.]
MTTPWVVQIFAISDARAEELIVGLLAGVKDIVVERATSGSDHFVITECADSAQARSIARIVTSIDFNARLLHTTCGSARSTARRSVVPSRMAG